MQYRIISVSHPWSFTKMMQKLTQQVNEAIAQGWEPHGGVSLSTGVAAQAMVKRR